MNPDVSQFDVETAVVESVESSDQDAGMDVFAITLSDQWNIGVNPNGGYAATIVLGAMARSLDVRSADHPLPLSVTTHYQRPALANEPARVEVEVVRQGRTTSTISGRLIQDGKERVRLLATFGALTPADPGLKDALTEQGRIQLPAYDMASPEDSRSRSELAQGVELPILSRLDIRVPDCWAIAGEADEAVTGGWIRFADGRPPDARSLVLFSDGFPPSPFGLFGRLGWVPTLELTVHVRRPPANGWIRARFETRDLVGGLFVEDGVLWDSTGAVVAQSRQLALLRIDQ